MKALRTFLAEWPPAFKHLVSQNVDEKLASRIVRTVEERAEAEQVHDYAHVRNLCVQVMAELIRKPRDIEFKKASPGLLPLLGQREWGNHHHCQTCSPVQPH